MARLFTHENIGSGEIFVSLMDLTETGFGASMSLLDGESNNPQVSWDETFQDWMVRYLETEVVKWLRWDVTSISNNKIYRRLR